MQNIAVCVVVEQASPDTTSFAAALGHSPFFDAHLVRDRRQCQADLVAGRIKGIVVLPASFSASSARSDEAQIQVLADGSDPNTAGLVQNYLVGMWDNWLAEEQLVHAQTMAPPVTLMPRIWYNPAHESREFLLPGLVAVNMTLIGTLLTALVVAREWERGTMEAMMATPISIIELLIGKLAPYYILGMAAMALSVGITILVFGVPFRGSLLVLAGVSSVFLVAMLAIGLLVSTITRNQFLASQIALILGFMPSVMLSGFLFEIASMPLPIRVLTYALPSRYFVPSLQTLFLAGDVRAVLLPNVLAMGAIAAIVLVAVARVTRLRLD